jgi:hypothetical protein
MAAKKKATQSQKIKYIEINAKFYVKADEADELREVLGELSNMAEHPYDTVEITGMVDK